MAGIYSQGGSAGHRYAGWLSEVEAKNFIFGGKVFNGSPSAIYVGSNLVWAGLKDAAIRAILGAFGQTDGMAVINATNAYLNQLAASGQAGKDKATALAGFINEDPMMVCSLGLEVEGVTMPIRWLVASGGAYINTGIYPEDNTISHVIGKIVSTEDYTWTDMFGCRNGYANKCYFLSFSVSGQSVNVCVNSGVQAVSFAFALGDTLDMTIDAVNHKAKINSTEVSIQSVSKPDYAMYIFAQNNGGTTTARNTRAIGMLEYTGYKFVPFKHKVGDTTVNCMIDLDAIGVEGRQIYFNNAGTGSFTIPDISYTPSTP